MNIAFTPGPWEVLLLLVVILLLFGAKRLPDLARSLGRSLQEFKKGKEEGARESDQKKIEEPPSEDGGNDRTRDA